MTVNLVIISLLINNIDKSEGRNSQDPCLIKVFKGLVMTPNSAIVVMITTRSLRYKTLYCASLLSRISELALYF